jgi:hypothetical protein
MMNYVSLVSLPQFALHHSHGHGPNLGIFNLKLSVAHIIVVVTYHTGTHATGTGLGERGQDRLITFFRNF